MLKKTGNVVGIRSHLPRMTPKKLLLEAYDNSEKDWDDSVIDFIGKLGPTLKYLLCILLEDFDYYENIKSDQTIAARSVAALFCRLTQTLENEKLVFSYEEVENK